MVDSNIGSNEDKSLKIPGPGGGEVNNANILEQDDSDPTLMSFEDLDTLINERDPTFGDLMSNIAENVKSDGLDIETLNYDELLDEGLGAWANPNGWRAKLLLIFPKILKTLKFIVKTKSRIKKDIAISKLLLIRVKEIWWPNLLQHLKLSAFKFLKNLKYLGQNFVKLPIKTKLIFSVLTIGIVVVALLSYRVATKGVLPPPRELFITSMEAWADKVYLYNIDDEPMEGLFESSRTVQNVVYLQKLMANIRSSKNSSENPMVALELFLDGTTPEVVIEIKGREHEIRDRFLRVIEGISYKQIASSEGKRLLCDVLKKEANLFLTTGKIRKVLIKTIVIKP